MEWLATLLLVVLVALLLRGSGAAQDTGWGVGRWLVAGSAGDYGKMAGWGALSLTGALGYWCEDVRGLMAYGPSYWRRRRRIRRSLVQRQG